jgi:hypothetical protein
MSSAQFHDATNTALLSHTLDWRRLYLAILEIQLTFLRDSGDYSAISRIFYVFMNHLYVSEIAKAAGRSSAELTVYPNLSVTPAGSIRGSVTTRRSPTVFRAIRSCLARCLTP